MQIFHHIKKQAKEKSMKKIYRSRTFRRLFLTLPIQSLMKKICQRRVCKSENYPKRNLMYIRSCFTGGPCAGKTTGIITVKQKLEGLGYNVFIVPEAATLLCRSGFQIANTHLDLPRVVQFQINLMKVQIALENAVTSTAMVMQANKKTLVLCDRGVMDGSAYMTSDSWQAMLDETGYTIRELRDKRYDMVLHMVTAAEGAEEFYNNSNNETRYEDLEFARLSDERTKRGYVGHSYFSIIDNSYPSFADKIEACASRILYFNISN